MRKYTDEQLKQRHNAYNLQKIQCPACLHVFMRANKSKHKKTNVHRTFMEKNPDWQPPVKEKKLSIPKKLELAEQKLEAAEKKLAKIEKLCKRT